MTLLWTYFLWWCIKSHHENGSNTHGPNWGWEVGDEVDALKWLHFYNSTAHVPICGHLWPMLYHPEGTASVCTSLGRCDLTVPNLNHLSCSQDVWKASCISNSATSIQHIVNVGSNTHSEWEMVLKHPSDWSAHAWKRKRRPRRHPPWWPNTGGWKMWWTGLWLRPPLRWKWSRLQAIVGTAQMRNNLQNTTQWDYCLKYALKSKFLFVAYCKALTNCSSIRSNWLHIVQQSLHFTCYCFKATISFDFKKHLCDSVTCGVTFGSSLGVNELDLQWFTFLVGCQGLVVLFPCDYRCRVCICCNTRSKLNKKRGNKLLNIMCKTKKF